MSFPRAIIARSGSGQSLKGLNCLTGPPQGILRRPTRDQEGEDGGGVA